MGEEIERILGADPPLHKEAWHRIKGWYRDSVNRMPPPAQVTLDWIMAERLDIYCHVPSPGGNIPVSVETFQVEESVPTEDKIEWLVKRLINHRSGGPSGIRVGHLKGWLAESRKEEAAAEKATVSEGRVTVIRGPGGY